jgi:multiple antibiotic resistance protein
LKETILHCISAFMAFFAIMNPIANVPIFLGLTGDEDSETTAAIARRSLILAFIIITIFSIAGKTIFQLFGITLPAFKITGGLLVFVIGFHMLQGNHSSVQHPSREDKLKSREAELGIAVSPLAMPILAGPGTIATAISLSAGGGYLKIGITVAMFAILCIITYILFVFGERFVNYIGTSALNVITRMMGLILAVIGTQMVIAGLQGTF